jgi:hypothetical protein
MKILRGKTIRDLVGHKEVTLEDLLRAQRPLNAEQRAAQEALKKRCPYLLKLKRR